MQRLTSGQNPLLKSLRKAVQKGTLTADGALVAEGPHLVVEAIQSERGIPAVLVSDTQDAATWHRLAAHGLSTDHLESYQRTGRVGRVQELPAEEFDELTGTEHSQGILALVEAPRWGWEDVATHGDDPCLVIVLDGIQDPGNAGAILRAAEAFDATGAVLLKGSANPFNPKCVRASAGSIFRLPFLAGVAPDDLLREAGDRMMRLLASRSGGAAEFEQTATLLRQSCAVIIGSEGRGVDPRLAEKAETISIPTRHVESLNAAVAAGILLYEARRRRGPAKNP